MEPWTMDNSESDSSSGEGNYLSSEDEAEENPTNYLESLESMRRKVKAPITASKPIPELPKPKRNHWSPSRHQEGDDFDFSAALNEELNDVFDIAEKNAGLAKTSLRLLPSSAGPSTSGSGGTAAATSEDNDALFYDPRMDDADQQWIDKQRRQYQPKQRNALTNKLVSQNKKLPNSDAVLNCPCCMGMVCLDCQRHEIYSNQYRAMFVFNCKVDFSSTLFCPKVTRGKKKKKSKKEPPTETPEVDSSAAATSASADLNKEDLFHPVKCATFDFGVREDCLWNLKAMFTMPAMKRPLDEGGGAENRSTSSSKSGTEGSRDSGSSSPLMEMFKPGEPTTASPQLTYAMLLIQEAMNEITRKRQVTPDTSESKRMIPVERAAGSSPPSKQLRLDVPDRNEIPKSKDLVASSNVPSASMTMGSLESGREQKGLEFRAVKLKPEDSRKSVENEVKRESTLKKDSSKVDDKTVRVEGKLESSSSSGQLKLEKKVEVPKSEEASSKPEMKAKLGELEPKSEEKEKPSESSASEKISVESEKKSDVKESEGTTEKLSEVSQAPGTSDSSEGSKETDAVQSEMKSDAKESEKTSEKVPQGNQATTTNGKKEAKEEPSPLPSTNFQYVEDDQENRDNNPRRWEAFMARASEDPVALAQSYFPENTESDRLGLFHRNLTWAKGVTAHRALTITGLADATYERNRRLIHRLNQSTEMIPMEQLLLNFEETVYKEQHRQLAFYERSLRRATESARREYERQLNQNIHPAAAYRLYEQNLIRHQDYHRRKMAEVSADCADRLPNTINDQVDMEFHYGFGQRSEGEDQMLMRAADFHEAIRHRLEIDRYEQEYYAADTVSHPPGRGPSLDPFPPGHVWQPVFPHPLEQRTQFF
ncbi:unnamed protein product [Cyprideis torosa]|uniref:Uncharacterized protein n=1 Tax=Cyprideis torosa TaxID=163714 RepID=A0A7R8W8Z8_9CRUS|nr:unnamed protein product [Cyprideis torosa]CAG0883887.1 unnamed protein product [Cyprideis torosa]